MKVIPTLRRALGGALLALTAPAVQAFDPAIASYFIGVDGQAIIPTGTYAGLPNPNHQRLTFLYAHT